MTATVVKRMSVDEMIEALTEHQRQPYIPDHTIRIEQRLTRVETVLEEMLKKMRDEGTPS
jgi:hypothetical protein